MLKSYAKPFHAEVFYTTKHAEILRLGKRLTLIWNCLLLKREGLNHGLWTVTRRSSPLTRVLALFMADPKLDSVRELERLKEAFALQKSPLAPPLAATREVFAEKEEKEL